MAALLVRLDRFGWHFQVAPWTELGVAAEEGAECG
jgi:hypothetical protein